MKKIIGLLAICITSNVFAQPPSAPTNPIQAADVLELMSLDMMPIPLPPGEADRMRKNTSTTASDGFSSIEKAPEMVRAFHNHMNAAKTYVARQDQTNVRQNKNEFSAPEVHKDLSTLKLGFKVAFFGRGEGALVAAAPNGTQVNDAWTGVERFFQINGAGSVHLSEVDLLATGGKFYMMKEAVNTHVHGEPAISKVFADDDGQTIEKVVWVKKNKLYMLTYGPDLIPDTKTKATAHISAHSLAQELQ